jgi:predicted ATPase/class 3 adenylate cyclase
LRILQVNDALASPADLARLVPSFLLERLAGQPKPLPAAYSDSSRAAVLFADVSGFTALCERLAQRGPEGVEELTQVLNTYFGQLIDLITAHGGDVVKFAGDALLAFWPVQTEAELETVTHYAAQCGLRVQEVLQTYATTTGHRLSLRVGIGAGKVATVSVGGIRKRWECILVGPPVIAATKASAQGQPGSVAVGATAWQHLLQSCQGTELSADSVRLQSVLAPRTPVARQAPTVTEAMVPSLLAYVPAAIHSRLAAGQHGWLAEMRSLTVLFVNLPELNHHMSLARSQEAMQALQTDLYHYEGSVNKLSVDEKGVTLVAALGLPPLAHEDDELRGTLAALAMQARLARLGWRTSIGVTSGRVFCGTIGSDKRCEYTIIGSVVNLSARLMQAAHGSILCDAPTRKAAEGKLAWETLPPITVKGRTEPIPVFKPLGWSQPAAEPPTTELMVGRTGEQERLAQLLRRLRDEQTGGVVLIEGEAGIGKSTLVANVLRRAHELDLTAWLGEALAIERTTPYFVWRPIFHRLFHLDSSSVSLDEQRLHVLAELAFDPDLPPLAPLLDVVLNLDFPATLQTAQMRGEIRLSNTDALLIRLLVRQTAVAPLLLVLEDCHWLDSASWALARHVAQQVPALLLVLVTRPLSEPLPRDYIPLANAPTTEHVTLSPLSGEETLALVRRRLGVAALPEPVAALLSSKAQGNPFFIEELAYALRDSGKIQISNGQCTIAAGLDLQTLPFPNNVQGVVTSRIDHLAPQPQLVLKVASVIGRAFSHRLVRDVCPITDAKVHLRRHLDVLVQHSLTTLDAQDPDPAYSFKHVITQEVAYHMMPPAQRKTLHQAVAEWYESHHRSDLSPFYPLLAKHWSNTEQAARAITYLEKSGENAMREFAHEEAVVFFSQALELERQSGQTSDGFRRGCWERQLGEAYYSLGAVGESRKHFQTALELLGVPLPRTQAGFLLSTVWEFARQWVHRLLPSWFVGRARHLAAQRLEAARAYERLVEIHYINNEKMETLHRAFKALNLSETVGECPELARNYAHAAIFCGFLMLHGPARAHARRAQELAEKINQPACTAYVNLIRAMYWVTVGEWETGEEDLVKAIAIAERTGEKRRWFEATFTLAKLLSRKGNYRHSARLCSELHRSATRRGVPHVQVWGISWHLWCLLALEPDSPQLAPLETALCNCLTAHPSMPLGDQILGYGLFALTRWRHGQVEEALAAAKPAEEIMSRSNQVAHYLLAPYAGLAEVYMGAWEALGPDKARVQAMQRRTRRLCRVLAQFCLMYPVGRPEMWLVYGQYQWLRGRPRRARFAWQKALAAAQRYRMPYEEARAHLALGRHLPAAEPDRPAHLARARELFTQIGATYYLRQLS